MWYPQILVKIRASPYVPVRFIYCVEEVGAHDDDVDAPAVGNETRGAWLWFGISGSYCDTVIYSLNPSCHHLGGCQSRGLPRWRGETDIWQKGPACQGKQVARHYGRSRRYLKMTQNRKASKKRTRSSCTRREEDGKTLFGSAKSRSQIALGLRFTLAADGVLTISTVGVPERT